MTSLRTIIIVPPFAGIDRPALGPHLLQASAREAGFDVDLFYANLEFAKLIGDSAYEAIAYAPSTSMAGERMFARAAFGTRPWGRDADTIAPIIQQICDRSGLEPHELEAVEISLPEWCTQIARTIVAAGYQVVGCSTTFEQTASSLAILQSVKRLDPAIITILGGANCEGAMGSALLRLDLAVDYVFRGESEESFVDFLTQLHQGHRPEQSLINGKPIADLDGLPWPDFSTFFDQLANTGATPGAHWLSCESSRGCWWGQKQHCTFCGLNAEGLAMRSKSADRVLDELKFHRHRYGPLAVCMTDNIMPYQYFNSLLPQLPELLPGSRIFYEVKANLKFSQVRALVTSGIGVVQPGIESLSTSLLKRMRKGVTARQNIELLRNAKSCGLELRWNLLYGFPGDQYADYEDQLTLLPLLEHLEPPQGTFPVTIDRFSPYFFDACKFGIGNLRPLSSYQQIFPESADLFDLAYHFEGDFISASRQNPQLVSTMKHVVECWQSRWKQETRPVLAVISLDPQRFLLFDSREIKHQQAPQIIDQHQALAALGSLPLNQSQAVHQWARESQLAVAIDQWHVGLATAEPQLLSLLEIQGPERTQMGKRSIEVLETHGE